VNATFLDGAGTLSGVKPERLLWELEALANRLGVAVRVEVLADELQGRPGGLCRVHGKPIVFVDASLGIAERSVMLAKALASFELDAVSMPPLLREIVASARPNPNAVR
jgi:hypothetical protein